MQVTISLIPASLSLVHIPRSRLAQLSHPVLRQILQPKPTFLNITCNEVELSIFADESVLKDFEPIARRDRYKRRSPSGSGRNRSGSTDGDLVEISCEKWSVLQIDSHSDQMDSSGQRVYELSAPLAAAGISILYQSTYMSDFIFVKESRLQEAIDLFSGAGFDIYSSEFGDITSKPLSESLNRSSSVGSRHSSIPSAVLTRNRNGTDSVSSDPPSRRAKAFEPPSSPDRSPSSGEVRLLPSDFACVGLSDEFGVDHWGLKIVKLVAFPDLIPSTNIPRRPIPSFLHISPITSTPVFELPSAIDSRTYSSSGSSSSSNDEDGYLSHSPESLSYSSLPKPVFRSSCDLRILPTKSLSCQHSSKHSTSTLSAVSPITTSTRSRRSSTESSSGIQAPFFSYTRTSEGSSLTADVYILATLFPPHERHMVICSGELDAADIRLANGIEPDDEDDSEGQDDSTSYLGNTLKCLQVDLRRYGLDKYGLVSRFSRVLDENGINHMYSSTVKTANLLVEKQHAIRAQALLRTC